MKFYEPAEDSLILLKWVEKLSKGRVLDMGTGSGIQAMGASKKADEVIAVDINPDAVKASKEWIKEKDIKNVKVMLSDLFSNVEGKFDVIIFNAPYLPEDEEVKDTDTMGRETTLKFLREANNYLNKNGFILLVVSSHTNMDDVARAGKKFKIEILEKATLFFEELYVLKLTND
ncbi:MAG: methyltransferase [Candidatus Nanoarchaeia archaeon]|nr:methyltransferase [Candidatus Nanoarchaeia archaeon]